MKNILKIPHLGYRFQQVFIFVLHIVLLKWILFTLYQSATLTMNQLMLHFTGMALFGAVLIRYTAFITKKHYLKNRP